MAPLAATALTVAVTAPLICTANGTAEAGSIDPAIGVPGYDSWWDVAVAEVSDSREIRDARAAYETARRKERDFL